MQRQRRRSCFLFCVQHQGHRLLCRSLVGHNAVAIQVQEPWTGTAHPVWCEYKKYRSPSCDLVLLRGNSDREDPSICAPAAPAVATPCGGGFQPADHILHDLQNRIGILTNPFASFQPLSDSPVSIRMKTFCLLSPDRFSGDNLFFGTVHSPYRAVAAASGHGKEFAHIAPGLSRFSMG